MNCTQKNARIEPDVSGTAAHAETIPQASSKFNAGQFLFAASGDIATLYHALHYVTHGRIYPPEEIERVAGRIVRAYNEVHHG